MNSKRFFKLFCAIFLIVGIILIVAGIVSQINTSNFLKTAIKTDAKITDIITSRDTDGDLNHDVYISFIVDGKTYEGRLNGYNSSMYTGGLTTIYYNPDNPNDFIGNDGTFFNCLLIALGVAFATVSIFIIHHFAKKNREKFRLQEEGICLHSKITSIHKDLNFTYNNKNPNVIECSCEYNGKIYTFTSEHIWSDAKLICESKNITELEVLVDPEDFNKYYVNIEPLKNYIGNGPDGL